MNKSTSLGNVEWRVTPGLTDYPHALDVMEARVAAIQAGNAAECLWLLEHPPLYTAGTSADPAELRNPAYPVYPAGRGGRYTYHGPGQRVVYVMLDLNQRGRDVRHFVQCLEGWMIAALAALGLRCWQAEGRIGIWTATPQGEAKIGAIGVRVRRWVSYHGFSINHSPDLAHFGGIVPCGISEYGVTSVAALGSAVDMPTLDAALEGCAPDFLAALSAAR